MKNWRVLSLLMDGKGSITLDRSGLKLGDEVSGHIEAEVTAWIETRMRMRDEGVGAVARRERAIRAVGGRS